MTRWHPSENLGFLRKTGSSSLNNGSRFPIPGHFLSEAGCPELPEATQTSFNACRRAELLCTRICPFTSCLLIRPPVLGSPFPCRQLQDLRSLQIGRHSWHSDCTDVSVQSELLVEESLIVSCNPRREGVWPQTYLCITTGDRTRPHTADRKRRSQLSRLPHQIY